MPSCPRHFPNKIVLFDMLRSCTSILLIVVHLAGQLALAPHAHGEGEFVQHSDSQARPHVHLAWFGKVTHAHDRGQDRRHDHQRGDPGRRSLAPTSSDCGSPLPGDDHDGDTVYLPGEVSAPALKSGAETGQAACAKATTQPAVVMAPLAQSPQVIRWVLLDDSPPSCPRYLMLRALRI